MSWSISIHFVSSEVCVAAQNKKNKLKTRIFGVQGRSMSLKSIQLKKLVTSVCYDKQHVCAYLQLFSH